MPNVFDDAVPRAVGKESSPGVSTAAARSDHDHGLDPNVAMQQVQVEKNSTGTVVGLRRRVNFIEGSNITLTITDDPAADRVSVTIAAAAQVHGVAGHTGKIGETELMITMPVKRPVPGVSVNAHLARMMAPFAGTAKRLKAWTEDGTNLATATTFEVNIAGIVFGTVVIAAAASSGTSDPADLAFTENQFFTIDINVGGGDDKGVLVGVVCERDVEATIA